MDETGKHARNLEEAAQHFGISVPTLRRWIALGAAVVRQGGNGVGYEIDGRAMAIWREESAAAEAVGVMAERAERWAGAAGALLPLLVAIGEYRAGGFEGLLEQGERAS